MKRFVAFTDHHGSEQSAREVVRLACDQKAEFLVCGGDISLFEEEGIASWRRFRRAGIPVYFIGGNHETADYCRRIESIFPYAHWIGGKVVTVGEIQLAGIDGSDDIRPNQMEDLDSAGSYVDLIRAQRVELLPLILVTHYPPAGTACCGHEPIYEGGVFRGHSGGKVLGSRVIREVVDILKPQIAICGHFHDRFGMSDKVGDTLIINPGPRGACLVLPAGSMPEVKGGEL